MLLPRPQLDEDGNEVDPREDLVQKLLEYKRFKAILPLLQQLEDDRQQQEKRGNIVRELAMVGKQNNPGEELTTLDLYKLLKIYEKVLKRYQLQNRSEEHTSELQSLMRISYAVFCLKKKTPKCKLIDKTTQTHKK